MSGDRIDLLAKIEMLKKGNKELLDKYLENELETTRKKLIKETDRNRKLHEIRND